MPCVPLAFKEYLKLLVGNKTAGDGVVCCLNLHRRPVVVSETTPLAPLDDKVAPVDAVVVRDVGERLHIVSEDIFTFTDLHLGSVWHNIFSLPHYPVPQVHPVIRHLLLWVNQLRAGVGLLTVEYDGAGHRAGSHRHFVVVVVLYSVMC